MKNKEQRLDARLEGELLISTFFSKMNSNWMRTIWSCYNCASFEPKISTKRMKY